MIPFRRYFNLETPKVATWLEMGQRWTPKDHQGWMTKFPPGALNLISITPGSEPEENEEDQESTIKQSSDVRNQARVVQWLLQTGLYKASIARKKFVNFANFENKELAQPVTELDVFSPEYHRDNPEFHEWWERTGKKIWFSTFEPLTLEQDGLIIDIPKANAEIKKIVGDDPSELFHFGGLDGFMQYLEKGSWAPKQSSKEKYDRQGPDLSNASFYIDKDSGTPFVRFEGMEAPKSLRWYEDAIRKHLFDTDKIMGSESKEALTNFQKALQFDKKKKKNYSYATQHAFTMRYLGDKGWLPTNGTFPEDTYEEIKDLIVLGLQQPHYSSKTKKNYEFTPEQQAQILDQVTKDKSGNLVPGRIKARFPNPVTGNRTHPLMGIINAGAKAKEGFPATSDLILHSPKDIDHGNFASIRTYEPTNVKGDLETITDALYGDGWRWELQTPEERHRGMPSEDRATATLRKGNATKKVKKGKHGWVVYEPSGKEPCGPGGCGIITGLNIRVNQDMVRKIPQSKEETQATINDMLANPWKYGEVEIDDKGASFNNEMELPSVRRASSNVNPITTGIDYNKFKKDFSAQGSAKTAAVNWLYNNTGDDKFLYGDLTDGKWILPELEKLGLSPEEQTHYLKLAQQAVESNKQLTGIDDAILEAFLKNGQKWRQYQMSNFVQKALKATYKDDPEMQYKNIPVDPETGADLIDQEEMSPEDKELAYARSGLTAKNRGRKKDLITQDITGVHSVDNPDNLGKDAQEKIKEAGKNKIKLKRRSMLPDSKNYDHKYNQVYSKLNSSNEDALGNIDAEINTLRNSKDAPFIRLGAIDAVHDHVNKVLSSQTGDSEATDTLTKVSDATPDIIKTLQRMERDIFKKYPKNLLIGDDLINKAQIYSRVKGTPTIQQPVAQPVAQPQPQSRQFEIPVSKEFYTQYVYDAMMQRDEEELAHLRNVAAKNPEYQQIYDRLTSQQSQQIAHHNPMQIGMVSFAEWRSLKETDAIYDGTPAKDGCGFNWWGAVGKPGGVSIDGEVKTRKKKNVRQRSKK